MNISIAIPTNLIRKISSVINEVSPIYIVAVISFLMGYIATVYAFAHDLITAYGDAESHLNISKRVVDSITPGFAQLGGVWLPLPHLLMLPLVHFDFLWRSGLAGSIVSGICFIISCVFLYKIGWTLTKNRLAAFMTFVVFAINPNILYLQATPLTEIPLITFFILSTYYFILYLQGKNPTITLIFAAFFGFCATLSRYDGWFLVLFEALIILIQQYRLKAKYSKIIGLAVLFGTLAFFGILCWFAWDGLILGDPFYFTNSEYSAKAQQMAWLQRNQLPAYHNPFLSFLYYFVDAMTNIGVIVFFISIIGFIYFLKNPKNPNRFYIGLLLMVPFIFNVLTLFMGQSVIFLPHLTPVGFDWRLFNARYGVIMMPAAAIFVSYLFSRVNLNRKLLLVFLLILQIGLFVVGYSKVIAVSDGIEGLSASKRTDSQLWLKDHYDGGLVLLDDFARSVEIIKSNIPMQKIIYIGNKPYWDDSMTEPEKYATWVVMQKNDAVYNHIYENPAVQARLYKYFVKVYTSPDILIFKRTSDINTQSITSSTTAQ